MGTIEANTVEGIFGELSESAAAHITSQAMPIGLKQEVETGPAQILCSVGGEPQLYDIKITANTPRPRQHQQRDRTPGNRPRTPGDHRRHSPGNKWRPILQEGKIIGAIPTSSYKTPPEASGYLLKTCYSNEPCKKRRKSPRLSLLNKGAFPSFLWGESLTALKLRAISRLPRRPPDSPWHNPRPPTSLILPSVPHPLPLHFSPPSRYLSPAFPTFRHISPSHPAIIPEKTRYTAFYATKEGCHKLSFLYN